MPTRPNWWRWEFELSSHLLKRMIDRGLSEVDVRRMISAATGVRRDIVPGRWVVSTRHRRRAWEVIVEPDLEAQVTVVVTAYPLG